MNWIVLHTVDIDALNPRSSLILYSWGLAIGKLWVLKTYLIHFFITWKLGGMYLLSLASVCWYFRFSSLGCILTNTCTVHFLSATSFRCSWHCCWQEFTSHSGCFFCTLPLLPAFPQISLFADWSCEHPSDISACAYNFSIALCTMNLATLSWWFYFPGCIGDTIICASGVPAGEWGILLDPSLRFIAYLIFNKYLFNLVVGVIELM